MAVKKFKPMTPGTRHKVIGTFDDITSSTPEKSLLTPLKSTGGRNNSGKMTVRYIGGGHKKMYRIVDFKRNKDNMSGTVKTIEYDPNRSARIALITYADGEKRYILAPNGLQVGQVVSTGAGAAPEVGNTLFLSDIPLGTVIHNIELYPGQGARDGPQCPVPTRSFWPAKANMLLSSFPRAKPAWCSLPAALRSASCRIPTTASSRTVRRAASAGSDAVRATGAFR